MKRLTNKKRYDIFDNTHYKHGLIIVYEIRGIYENQI